MSNYDQRRALEGLQKLDSQAISAVYDLYFPEVYRYILYRLSDQTVAEDLASDVFMRLLEAAQSGRGPQTHIIGWLIATASHVVTDHLRHRYRRPVDALLSLYRMADQPFIPSLTCENKVEAFSRLMLN